VNVSTLNSVTPTQRNLHANSCLTLTCYPLRKVHGGHQMQGSVARLFFLALRSIELLMGNTSKHLIFQMRTTNN
jgi:hypothetical protein